MILSSPQDLQTYAKVVAKDHNKILLTGDLGAGKTTFTGGYVTHRDVPQEQVNSPTYTYINTYSGSTGETILHVDMYRISSYEQAVGLGIFDLIDQHYILVIERPKRQDEYVDTTWSHIHIEKISEKEREVSIMAL